MKKLKDPVDKFTGKLVTFIMLFRPAASLIIGLTVLSSAVGVGAQTQTQIPIALRSSVECIQGERILSHIKVLASDKFEGRSPGSRGETLTVSYLLNELRKAGLKPGNPNGTFLQQVRMIGYRSEPQIELTVGDRSVPMKFLEDFVHDRPSLQRRAKLDDVDVVFAGYGIVAPQYGWDDYKGADVKNKLVVVLMGEPSRYDAAKAPDATFFRGETRTYYSTLESKYEAADKRGAAGILVITDPERAQTFSIFKTFAEMEGMALRSSRSSQQSLIAGLITRKAVERIVGSARLDLAELERSAKNKDFEVAALKATASISITSKIRQFASSNVVAKVEGSDPKLKDEYVIFSAHWDHLGRDRRLVGDQIYNGANDNAAGVAQLLEVARGLKAAKPRPRRSFLFIVTTGEEKGFLGSRSYAQNPLYPIAKTVAAFNLDAGNPFGLTSDLASSGFGNSTLDNALAKAAEMQGRTFLKESLDGNGSYYFASDQIEFAKVGIPSAFPWSGATYIGRPAGWGEKKWDEYVTDRYHQVRDEVMPDWDMSGAAEDARWMMIAGYLVADEIERPVWLTGTEFKKQVIKAGSRRR